MKISYLALIISSSLMSLTACSSSSDSPGSADSELDNSPITSLFNITGSLNDVQQLGWVFLTDSESSQRLSIFATFFLKSDENGAIQRYISREADNCTVELLSEDILLLEDSLLNDYDSISAGEVLSISSPAGSYAELTRFGSTNRIGYSSVNPVQYPVPQSLTINVPGDEFGMSSISIEKPLIPTNVSLADGDITAVESSLTWAASSSNDTLLYAYFEDLSNPDLYVECLLIDDGMFTLPESVFTNARELLGGDVSLTLDGISRIRAVSSSQGSDLFVVVRSSS